MSIVNEWLRKHKAAIELNNLKEMERIKSEFATYKRESELALAKRLARMSEQETEIIQTGGEDYLNQARNILKD